MKNSDTPWNGRRYYPISQYFRKKFGERTAKISVSIAEQCPAQGGYDGVPPCIFCDEWGSAAYHLERDRELLDQIQHNRKLVSRRLKSNKFLVYFQSYTNTLDKIAVLKERFDIALSEDYVHGLVIGTRPDCLPERLFPLLNETAEKTYLLVELGTQSFFNEHLEFLRRGHSAECSLEAILKLSTRSSVDIGIHLMFGLPGETDEQIIETARIINRLPISNVKLHNLHVLRDTPLAKLYQAGEFSPLELEPYAERVVLFLRHLSPNIAVQRLAAIASRWEELLAPEWTRHKMQSAEFIEKMLAERGLMQGDLYDVDARSPQFELLSQRSAIARSS